MQEPAAAAPLGASAASSWGNPQGIGMYQWVYWTGVTMFLAWTALSAFSALHGL